MGHRHLDQFTWRIYRNKREIGILKKNENTLFHPVAPKYRIFAKTWAKFISLQLLVWYAGWKKVGCSDHWMLKTDDLM
jgi:hypothetical protein